MILYEKQRKLLDEILEYLGHLKGEKATELNNRLYNDILKNWDDKTILEQAIIDEIDMVLECNFDNFETGLELSDEKKLEIAQDIIDYDDDLWEDLHVITMERVAKAFKRRRAYLEQKEKVCELDKDEVYELENLKEYIEMESEE
jgi:hypothetical protein